MEQLSVGAPQSVAPTQALETESFELELLDCGPGYSYGMAESLCACFNCVCGTACLCGCVHQQIEG